MSADQPHANRPGRHTLHFALLLAAALGPLLCGLAAQAQDKPRAAVSPKAPTKDGIEFRMENKRRKEVFGWLSSQTGVPFLGSPPMGTFTYIGPKGETLTVPEIVARIND